MADIYINVEPSNFGQTWLDRDALVCWVTDVPYTGWKKVTKGIEIRDEIQRVVDEIQDPGVQVLYFENYKQVKLGETGPDSIIKLPANMDYAFN